MVVDGGTVLISIDFAVQAHLSELLEEGGVDEFARQAGGRVATFYELTGMIG